MLALHARGCQRRCPVLLLGNKLDMEQYRYRPRGKAACSPWERAHRSPIPPAGMQNPNLVFWLFFFYGYFHPH